MSDSPGYSTNRCGYVNKNDQANLGRTQPPRPGTDHGQVVYVMRCLDCRRNYGANGSDIWLRKCPLHQERKARLVIDRG